MTQAGAIVEQIAGSCPGSGLVVPAGAAPEVPRRVEAAAGGESVA
jgi:hypothetical protein